MALQQINSALQKKNRVPVNISKALISSNHRYEEEALGYPIEKRFKVSANNADAKSFFMGLVDGTPYNMIVNSKVTGTITLELKNVTVEETLEAVRDGYGYEYRKTSYGYEVFPKKLETKIFNLNYSSFFRIFFRKTLTSLPAKP